MKVRELPDQEFRITIVRKVYELEENTERQFNKMKRAMSNHNEKFSRETEEILKVKQILKLITTVGKEHQQPS
jgi:hypothetical protein